MWLQRLLTLLLVAAAAGRGKRNRHQKPGRAVFDRLSSTVVSEARAAGGGALPPPLDVAAHAALTATATCGSRGAEEFCRDTPGKRGVVCDVCEGSEGAPSRRHPAAMAVDGDPGTWWQSPVFGDGEDQQADLVAELPGKMELLHVIIKVGPSPRALAWSLEVSPAASGDDWRLVRAFGDRDHCRRLWDLTPERRRRKARRARGVRGARGTTTCSTQFASIKPLENGEMHVGLGSGVAARRVRISFRAPHAGPHRYYTVRELTLAARCLCHGHATSCHVDSKSVKCSCLHGTCGFHCQRCCTGAPWAPHRPCPADDRADCAGAYDDTGAILCMNCTDNRAGPLCDKCLVGFYNVLPDDPCLPCECDPEGSEGTCSWDRQRHQLICGCRAGFAGPLCDACEDPSAQFPACLLPTTTAVCKCDPRGVVDPDRVCDEVCECKANVIGERCDTCAAGHFGLSAALAAGCRPCYCSHVAASCAADPSPAPDIVLPLGEAWLVSDNVTSETMAPSVDDEGKPYVISYEIEGWETFYWLSTTFTGDQLATYGGELRAAATWSVARGDTGGNPTVGPDFVLIARDGTRVAYEDRSYPSPGRAALAAALEEGRWYRDGEPASRHQLLDVLSDVRALLVKAHFHFDQDEVRLESVEIRGCAGAREICECPAGYEGPQCARCAWTHVRLLRAPGAAPAFECVPCACNMHASCDSVDGPCGECLHNTTGPHCERCLPGHYGNPVQGACKPCACPLFEAANNFSPNCALASAAGDDFVCTQCPDGYIGDHCELCDSGYWGSPSTPGGSCAPCDCGGGPCHPSTGRCLVCPPHTEGERCDQCQEGYWSGGENGSCVSCGCGAGALSAACDARTGRCACHPAWAGRTCIECAPGYGDVEAGCPPCRCGAAALSAACATQTGACECAAGAAPPHCDACLPDHYNFTGEGCAACRAVAAGAGRAPNAVDPSTPPLANARAFHSRVPNSNLFCFDKAAKVFSDNP
ncbi:laminin subunit alpha-1-like [Aricia agestis]|uniref:laminin subunit alpha-1-like n=1 Tax=Aricia agestis TaxID=91739 RepID=UPI001C20B664|nr:laminin subunit alpha-1-like [Aricia agestis]